MNGMGELLIGWFIRKEAVKIKSSGEIHENNI